MFQFSGSHCRSAWGAGAMHGVRVYESRVGPEACNKDSADHISV